MELSNISDGILERYITNIITHLGVPDHWKGYYYLRYAILLCVRDITAATNISNLVYPTVAKQFRTSELNVTRNIRSAIEASWKRGDTVTFEKIFSYSIKSGRQRPSNSEYIAQIADTIRLDIKSIPQPRL